MAPEIVARREKRGRINQHEMQIADVWGFGKSLPVRFTNIKVSESFKKNLKTAWKNCEISGVITQKKST